MKILLVGGTGTIGKSVADVFSAEREVVIASRSSKDFPIDIADSDSIRDLLKSVRKVDAIICAAGEARWDNFEDLSEQDFYIGIRSKLMGQVNLVRLGMDYLSEGGSFTLTTGILADDPVPNTTSAAMVNGAIHSFVLALSLEMKQGKRINVVSSGMVQDAYEKYKNYFPGHTPIPMDKMARAYVRSVKGKGNGQIIRVYE